MSNAVKEIPIFNTDRFFSKINVNSISGCWEWISTIQKSGYGVIRINMKRYYAHRISYALHNGSISKDFVIDHICMNRGCVNPSHLRQVTYKVNSSENTKKKKAFNVIGGKCLDGHLLDGDNIYVVKKDNSVRCRICKRNYENKWRKNVKSIVD